MQFNLHPALAGSGADQSTGPSFAGGGRSDLLQQTFVHRVEVAYEDCVSRLQKRGLLAGPQPRAIELGHSQVLGPLTAGDRPGRCRLDVMLWRGPLRPKLPMTLDIVSWSAAFGTWLELEPRRDVRIDGRYFREGNAVLDGIIGAVTGATPSTTGS